ncbi:MAG: hypothetical protein MI743_14600 [Sneathiellales bacterium]|nr:hypothetical protein [Sneathiellales bacterium]
MTRCLLDFATSVFEQVEVVNRHGVTREKILKFIRQGEEEKTGKTLPFLLQPLWEKFVFIENEFGRMRDFPPLPVWARAIEQATGVVLCPWEIQLLGILVRHWRHLIASSKSGESRFFVGGTHERGFGYL